MGASKNQVTLKALANVSPGFALNPGVKNASGNKRGATPSELRLREMSCVVPGLPKRNPGLEFANAFSVINFL
jgi:hypothetical protein